MSARLANLIDNLRDWPRDDHYYLAGLCQRAADDLATAHQLLRQAREALEDTNHVLTDWHVEHAEPADDCLLCQINAALDEGKTTA